MGDMAIKYKAKFQKLNVMIDNVKKLGFSVEEYKKILDSVNDRISKEIDMSYLSGKLVQGRMEQIYSTGIMELNKLEGALERYSVYFEVLNNCKYLDTKIDSKKLIQEELEKYVSKMIYNLKRIVKSDTVNYEIEKEVVEKVYDTAYNIIKLELVMTGDSQLYHYAKEEDVNISFFNQLVLRELSKLNLKDRRYDLINSRMYKLDSRGIDSNYFDLELIKLLLVYGDNINLVNTVMEKFCELKNIIDKYDNELVECISNTYKMDYKTKMYYDNVCSHRKKVFKKFISMILAYTIMITGGVVLEKNARKNNISDSYIKNMEIYSSLDGDTRKLNEEVIGNDINTDDYVYVRWYEPWGYNDEGIVERKYKEYNVSHIDLDTAYDYYIYGVDNYDVEPIEKNEVYDGDISLNEEVLYKGNHVEVEIGNYKYNKEILDWNGYEKDILYSSAKVSFLLMILYVCRLMYCDKMFFIASYFNKLKQLRNEKKNFKKFNSYLEETIEELMSVINSCEEYRNKFRELYEENKFLLDNPEELYRRINKLEKLEKIEDGKKLVKEYKKK